jgi:hypothetical protein
MISKELLKRNQGKWQSLNCTEKTKYYERKQWI